ncbi:Universal stress protein [Pseudomonas caricapapayae]|uniref:Universal stress protein n=2 Tax=Pseudomonas caricapapayae TaxID=46678 RepID=A0A3M6FIM5_9PSED|nr:Universal stress protein [Pseudomonas caricapapayae]
MTPMIDRTIQTVIFLAPTRSQASHNIFENNELHKGLPRCKRKSHTPTIAILPEDTLMPYEHILVAIDLTDECDPVIRRASLLATASEAKLSVVHIVEPIAMAFGGDVPMDLSQLQQQQIDQAREKLGKLKLKYPQLENSESHMVFGQPRQEIHKLAKSEACDLIVVGSHGRHGLALLLGSTANDVLHGAPCDVLAVSLKKPE